VKLKGSQNFFEVELCTTEEVVEEEKPVGLNSYRGVFWQREGPEKELHMQGFLLPWI
jgi:hypothetical protein